MQIEMTEVESHQIHSIGYDSEGQILAVRFRKGKDRVAGSLYHYRNVPQELYDEFASADSKGGFFNQQIKPFAEQYPFEKQPDPDQPEPIAAPQRASEAASAPATV